MKHMPKWSVGAVILAAALGLSACDVEKTEEGRLPDVDVKGGNLPKYDVDAPDVDVGTKEKTITVPDVDINPPEDDNAVGTPAR